MCVENGLGPGEPEDGLSSAEEHRRCQDDRSPVLLQDEHGDEGDVHKQEDWREQGGEHGGPQHPAPQGDTLQIIHSSKKKNLRAEDGSRPP